MSVLGDALDQPGTSWTAEVPLPGGDIPDGNASTYRRQLHARFPTLPPRFIDRIVRSYGTRAERWLGDGSEAALGTEIVPGLFEAELRYLVSQEWALTAEDILRRRSKLGLHLPPDAEQIVDNWIAHHT